MQQAEIKKSDVTALAQQWQEIRIAFISQGTSLHAFCKENGIHRPNAKKAFSGYWNGKKGEFKQTTQKSYRILGLESLA